MYQFKEGIYQMKKNKTIEGLKVIFYQFVPYPENYDSLFDDLKELEFSIALMDNILHENSAFSIIEKKIKYLSDVSLKEIERLEALLKSNLNSQNEIKRLKSQDNVHVIDPNVISQLKISCIIS